LVILGGLTLLVRSQRVAKAFDEFRRPAASVAEHAHRASVIPSV